MAHALHSRYVAVVRMALYLSERRIEKMRIIPPLKDVDLRALARKGTAVLDKMDRVSRWVIPTDWVRLCVFCRWLLPFVC